MSLIELRYAIEYALQTYTRRDLAYVLSQFFDMKDGIKGKGNFDLRIEHPEIEDYIKRAYMEDTKE